MSYATAGNSNEIDYTTRAKHYTNNTIEAFNKKLSIITAQTDIGKNVAILPTMKQKYIDTQLKTNLLYYIKKEWNCHICQERVKHMFRSLDKNLKSFICKDMKSIDKNTAEIYTSIGLTQDSIRKNYIQSTNGKEWDFTIVVKHTLYSNLLYQGADDHGNKYVHYAYTPNAYTDPSIHKKQLKSISNAFHKYFPLFYGMYEKLDITQEIIDSFKTMLDLLEKSTYGIQQKPSIQWILDDISSIYESYKDGWKNIPIARKIEFIIKNICKCSIGEDETGGAYIGFYHTINNNILDLLEKGESMSAVVKMISNRNDPSKYRRKTAAPKMAHIEKGEKLFADLENTIHTVEELEMLDHCFKIQSDKASTGMSVSSAFASMRNEAASNRNKNKYSGFAKRCSGKSDTTNLSEISTMSELIEKIKTGEIYDLKISPKTCSNVYTAKTSLDASDLSMPNIGHLWGYLNHESSNLGQRWSSLYFDDSWLDISHFCHIKTNTRENYIMIVKNSRRSLSRFPINSNCCFPEFLAPKHRSVESVFEKLGKMTKVSVPEYSDIGFGKGTSKSSSKHLSSNPRLKINHDIIITISQP
jgi:hypothetical protein